MDTDDWLNRLQLEEKIAQAGEVTLDRLQLLIQSGYQPAFGGELCGAIWLYHPRESFKYKELILHGSGLVASGSDECRFEREETQAFKKFLRTVPRPSLWERTRRGRINLHAWLFIGAWCCGAWLAAFIVVELVGRAF
jgi:hypothetical protein